MILPTAADEEVFFFLESQVSCGVNSPTQLLEGGLRNRWKERRRKRGWLSEWGFGGKEGGEHNCLLFLPFPPLLLHLEETFNNNSATKPPQNLLRSESANPVLLSCICVREEKEEPNVSTSLPVCVPILLFLFFA